MKNYIKRSYFKFKRKYHEFSGGNCAVLLYHRVTTLSSDPQLLSVTPENFDLQLSWLKKNHAVLSIDEFLFHLERKIKFPSKSVVLTFDDGYADNYYEALQVLEKYNYQALFYIATATINTTAEFWWDAVERIMLDNKNAPNQKNITIEQVTFELEKADARQRFSYYTQMLPLLRNMNALKRNKYIEQLSLIYDSLTPRVSHRAMTNDELLKHAHSNCVVIGAHTHNHPSLGALTYQEQWDEIKTSKQILERLLNREVLHFSFPFGTRLDYNSDTLTICRDLGFKMTAANYPYIVHCNTDKMQFPRFLVRNWDAEQFKNALAGFFS